MLLSLLACQCIKREVPMKLTRVVGLTVLMVLTLAAVQAAVAAYGPEDTAPLAEESVVRIDPPSRFLEASRGDPFTATVMVENAQDMVGYSFRVTWDSAVLRVTNVRDAGSLLEEPLASWNPSTGFFEALVFPNTPPDPPYEDGQDGDFPLAVIEMEAWGPGTSPLDLDGREAEWVDKDEVLHQPDVEDGTVEIEMDLELVFLPVVLRSYGP
jgi:hypothetical protein